MQNNRAFPRHDVRLSGKLIGPAAALWLDCEIRNLSEDGALVSAFTGRLPEGKFYLWQVKTATLFECEVRWRRNSRIGLRFTDAGGRARRRALIAACGLDLSPVPARLHPHYTDRAAA